MKAKRLTALFFVLVMVLSLTACQTKKTEEVTIEFWHTHGETFGGPALEEVIQKFNETNGKGITVKTVLYDQYNSLMAGVQTGLAGGTEPALSTIAYSSLNYASGNFTYVSPTEIIEKYFPEDKNYLSTKYEDAILELGVSIDGNQFGLPYGLSLPIVYYNLDILKEAGLDTENLPETWQEVRTYAETVVEKTGKQGLYLPIAGDTYSIIPAFYAAGIKEMYVADDDGSGYKANFNTPEAVEVFTFFQEMYENGSAVYVSGSEGLAAFSGGELAMYVGSTARLGNFKESIFELDTHYHPYWEGRDLAICLGGNMLAIWAQDEAKQKAAWEFIKFLLEPENMAAFDNATGYVPPTVDVTDEMYELLKNPLLSEIIDEKSGARQWTSWPGTAGLQVDQYLITMRDNIYNNFLDPADEIAKAEEIINELID